MSSQIVREIRPSVVMIERRKVGAVMASNILGTAFVADNAGYLLTAAHVVRGVDPEDLIVRTMFNLAGEYAMSSGRVEAVFLHSESDVAVIRVHRSLTKGRALRMEPAGPEVGDDVLMLGYALGTELTFCDDILGSASPKSPTPLAFRGSVSGLVPHDGRPVKVVVIDITTFAGNSGSPVVRAADGSVVGIHIRGVDRRVGYALPIELGVNLLGSVGAGASDSMPPASTLVGAQIDPGLAINALLEVLEQAADILNHQRGSRPDPRLIAEELVEQLGLDDQPGLLGYEFTAEAVVERVRDRPLVGPVTLARFELSEPIVEGFARKLEERLFRVGGEVWEIHKYDADPFPSQPHAHNADTGHKLCLATGDLYLKRRRVGTVKRKHLLDLRARASDLELPELRC